MPIQCCIKRTNRSCLEASASAPPNSTWASCCFLDFLCRFCGEGVEQLADGGSAGSEGKPMSLVQIHTGHIIRSCRDSAGGEGLMSRQEGDERLGFMTDKHMLLGSCATKAQGMCLRIQHTHKSITRRNLYLGSGCIKCSKRFMLQILSNRENCNKLNKINKMH